MITIKVSSEFDKEKILSRMKEAQYKLDETVLKDSNRYAPEVTGQLKGTGQGASSIGEGIVAWQLVQVPRLYYNPQYNFTKDVNPNAGGLWFEVAKQKHISEWIELVKKILTGG